MCGIIGFYTEDKKDGRDTIIKLFRQSKIRGLHAFGFSVPNDVGISTFKAHHLSQLEKKIMELPPFECLIGHNRYSTSGDWEELLNNQPIHLDNISLVFNGIISMRTKEENEAYYGRKYIIDNDGEILLRKIQDGDDYMEFIKSPEISFAGLHMKDGNVFCYRNPRRPMHYYVEGKSVFIASTGDIFKRALGVVSKEVEAHRVFELKELLN